MNNNINIFEEVEREKLLDYLSSQKEMINNYEDILEVDVDEKTGKLTREHLSNCGGCSLCEE